jgi:putative transposase
VRPHAALGGKTPAEVYRPVEKRPIAFALPNYPPEWRVRRVATIGAISFEGDHIFISIALARKLVGLRYEGGLRRRVYFFEVDLGTIEVASLNGVLSTVAVSSVNGSVNVERAADDARVVSV